MDIFYLFVGKPTDITALLRYVRKTLGVFLEATSFFLRETLKEAVVAMGLSGLGDEVTITLPPSRSVSGHEASLYRYVPQVTKPTQTCNPSRLTQF